MPRHIHVGMLGVLALIVGLDRKRINLADSSMTETISDSIKLRMHEPEVPKPIKQRKSKGERKRERWRLK